jgi:hypothetical protein
MTGINYMPQKVLATVPYVKELKVTPTYSKQLPPEHQVVTTLGNSKDIVAAIMSNHKPGLESKGEEQLEIQLELGSLGEELEALNASRSSRAKPFLQYALEKDKASSNLIGKIETGAQLTGGDIDRLTNQVYHSFDKNTGATESTKKAIRTYIRGGEADDETLQWFATYVDTIFKKPFQYNDLKDRLQRTTPTSDTSGLEQTLIQTVEAIKSGKDYQEEIEFNDLRINVYQELQQLTGVEPGELFPYWIDEFVKGEGTNGLIVPFEYETKGISVPEKLKPYYMSVDKFGQIITLFDKAIAELLHGHANESREISKILEEMKFSNIDGGVFIRAIFPESHQPTLTLYSDARIRITEREGDVRKIMELIRNEREEIPRGVAKHFDIPEEQIKFEKLISLQAQLMQLLPFPVYVCADTDSRMRSHYIEEAKKHRASISPKDRILLAKYELNDRQLQKDFGVNRKKITNITETTLDEAMQLFGEELGFIRKLESTST